MSASAPQRLSRAKRMDRIAELFRRGANPTATTGNGTPRRAQRNEPGQCHPALGRHWQPWRASHPRLVQEVAAGQRGQRTSRALRLLASAPQPRQGRTDPARSGSAGTDQGVIPASCPAAPFPAGGRSPPRCGKRGSAGRWAGRNRSDKPAPRTKPSRRRRLSHIAVLALPFTPAARSSLAIAAREQIGSEKNRVREMWLRRRSERRGQQCPPLLGQATISATRWMEPTFLQAPE